MVKSAADEKILSYNDVVLRQSDLEILSGQHFLNDRIIEFYFSHLSSSHQSEDVLLLPPSIAFWISNCPDTESLKDFLKPLKLADKKLVIFPVNNNDDVSLAEGGSHWSLLVYDRISDVFVHHDSFSGINGRHALQLYKAVARYLTSSDATVHAKYTELTDSPQQVNGWDCGLYVTATARAICYWYRKCDLEDTDSLWFSDVKVQVTPAAVAAMRTEILSLIKSLMVQLKKIGGDGIDYSEQFLSGETFESDAEAIKWAKGIAKHIGFELIISSHKNGGRQKILKCARGERYRGSSRDLDSAARKNTKTKACKCTFKIAVKLFGSGWIIVANAGITSMHNHAFEGQMSRLSHASKLIVRDMSAAQVKPCAILAALKEKNPSDNPTIRQVYNHRDYLRKSSFEGRDVVDTFEQAGCADKSEDHQYFREIVEEVMAQDRSVVRSISLMIRDHLHQEESSYSEPGVKTIVRDRPKGSSSTKPSAWEYNQRVLGRSSQGRVHTAPTSDKHTQIYGMVKSAADEKILSYNDVVLRQSDLEILSGRHFLNDRIIEFYFSYLSSSHPSEDVLLLPPSIAFWISNCPDTECLKDFLKPLKLADKKLVIFPVNDNDDVNLAEGGSHWSLLVYDRNSDVFVHHDSFSGTNGRHALRLYEAVARYLASSDATVHAKYMEHTDSPQQLNGWDCGLYVTATTRAICFWYGKREREDTTSLWFSDVKAQVTPAAVAAMRTEILSLIRSLMVSK
ncbi:uncharacterized protein LOC126660637 isoform X2 [Mercurialis annua]|uniref:uncharacterized protein LOC126660637 isoform X2 n=1 Tax=Mercurialis annua TaxID=3986 RepID=UPI0021604CF0|nr:uncharacterized protein LOC126660637 isoform X2 [Mercurialis annua]